MPDEGKRTTDEIMAGLGEFLRRENEDRRNGYSREESYKAIQALDARIVESQKEHARAFDAVHAKIDSLGNRVSGVEARVQLTEATNERHYSDIKELKGKTEEIVKEHHISSHDLAEEMVRDAKDEALRERGAQIERQRRLADKLWALALVVLSIMTGIVADKLFGTHK